ncbi:MAG: hypothetical protein H6Q90_3244 [Deltaproteobacteria bacterium]|nr:hypothetical protein [Deltaproteobacteria bacterium]
MGQCVVIGWLGVVAACGDPVLRNVPQPNAAVVAGAAAAVAGAATLAAPDAAAKNAAEANKPTTEKKPLKTGPSVPADVLDRLDQQGSGSGSDVAAPPGAQPPTVATPRP